MDVDRLSFYPLILDILTDISEAHFVSFDLELSGVPSKDPYANSAGKQSLQQRYLEVKSAAERYQILQIGLTCVEQDILNDKYVLRPYNFNLCPVIFEKGLDVERIFSFQSGAIEFLLKAGLNIGNVFTSGIPYLSRQESKIARVKHARRQDKTAMADIRIKSTDTQSLAFLHRVRNEINTWVSSRKIDTAEYLNIGPLIQQHDGDGSAVPEELSRYEKRLVHQLVRAEFPKLVSISRRGFVQVVEFDEDREDRIAENRQRELEERIARQKGFRWLIDALRGRNISTLDLRECAKDSSTGELVNIDLDSCKGQLHRAQARIRNNPKVLIGHNCFLDLVYIYRTFFDELPDTVEEFQNRIHELWPVIIDTKYMSTHECGDINPISSLEQISQQLSSEEVPSLETAEYHRKYDDDGAFHEAGYDSFLTAQVAVRLSAKLEREGTYIEVDKGSAGDVQNATNKLGNLKLTGKSSVEIIDTWAQVNTAEVPAQRGFTPSVIGAKWKRVGDPTVGPQDANEPYQYTPGDLEHRYHAPDVTIPNGMPKFASDFWRVYGNKLRVFGTEEGVCVLSGSSGTSGTSEGEDHDAGGVDLN